MVSNSLAATAVALELGGYPEEIAAAFADFPGVARRCEIVSPAENEIMVIDDYGHHPTEIRATLKAVREVGCHTLLSSTSSHDRAADSAV